MFWQLKIDGDFLYFLADAAVVAVSVCFFTFSTSIWTSSFNFK